MAVQVATLMQKFGTRLREIQVERGMTQEPFRRSIELPTSSLSIAASVVRIDRLVICLEEQPRYQPFCKNESLVAEEPFKRPARAWDRLVLARPLTEIAV